MSVIKVGDVVKVDFNQSQLTLTHYAEVKHIPCATGDSWIFEDRKQTYYVSEGCTITKLNTDCLTDK